MGKDDIFIPCKNSWKRKTNGKCKMVGNFLQVDLFIWSTHCNWWVPFAHLALCWHSDFSLSSLKLPYSFFLPNCSSFCYFHPYIFPICHPTLISSEPQQETLSLLERLSLSLEGITWDRDLKVLSPTANYIQQKMYYRNIHRKEHIVCIAGIYTQTPESLICILYIFLFPYLSPFFPRE